MVPRHGSMFLTDHQGATTRNKIDLILAAGAAAPHCCPFCSSRNLPVYGLAAPSIPSFFQW
jgi:hypothetical protein